MSVSSYLHVSCIRDAGRNSRSPLVFIHGYPDSAAMFSAYTATEVLDEPWAKKRSVFTISFPNRREHPASPSWQELRKGVLYRQFSERLSDLIKASPTGQICPVAHDWGAAYIWSFIREKGDKGIERLVALSVASSQRFDVWEHGIWAFAWSYRTFLALPFYLPISSGLVGYGLSKLMGYRGENLDHLDRDSYHYWDGLAWPLFAPLLLSGLKFKRAPFLNFKFPLLYMRAPADRFLSTKEFEAAVAARPDCRLVCLPSGYNHWFPEQASELVLAELRSFLGPQPKEEKEVKRGPARKKASAKGSSRRRE